MKLALAGVIFVSTASLACSYTRLRRTENVEGAPALKQRSDVRSQKSTLAVGSTSTAKAEVLDSDNDGIPDALELRTYQDRDAFRRWFTFIAENQFYRLSDQWNEDQRDCAGLARFATREALRRQPEVGDLRTAAFVTAINKVAIVYEELGIFP